MIFKQKKLNIISILRDLPDDEVESQIPEESYVYRDRERFHSMLMVYGLLG